MRMRPGRFLAACALAGTLLTTVGFPAGATNAPPDPLADGLVGPLSIDVGVKGDVLVGQAFAGVVSQIGRSGGVTDLFAEPGVTAVDHGLFGSIFYTVRAEDGSAAALKVRDAHGRTRVVADLLAYETTRNPDANQQYGFQELTPECAEQWPVEALGPPQYTGIPDSNPYAISTTVLGTLVADAGANAILHVSPFGKVRTVAVLPPQPLLVTPEIAEGIGVPACAGLVYNFEPVPTDVEIHRGKLYVSTLPGGPEDPSLGARGGVYVVDPLKGSSHKIGQGLLGATDVAVSSRGTVYVTELFGGQVTKLTKKGNVPVAQLDTPAAIEWARGKLYVAYEAFGSGKVSVISG